MILALHFPEWLNARIPHMSKKTDPKERLGERLRRLLESFYEQAVGDSLSLQTQAPSSVRTCVSSLRSLLNHQTEAVKTAFKQALDKALADIELDRDQAIDQIRESHAPCFENLRSLIDEANALEEEGNDKVNACYIKEDRLTREGFQDKKCKADRLQHRLDTAKQVQEETGKPLTPEIESIPAQIVALEVERLKRREELKETREKEVKALKDEYGPRVKALRSEYDQKYNAERKSVEAEIADVQVEYHQAVEALNESIEERQKIALAELNAHYGHALNAAQECLKAIERTAKHAREARINSSQFLDRILEKTG